MNILFYTSYKISPTQGGTERTTMSVATGLCKYYGYHCFSVFSINSDTPKESCFERELLWRPTDGVNPLADFVLKKRIDWIINQGVFNVVDILHEVREVTGCKVIFAHHFEPGWEIHFLTLKKYMADLRTSGFLKKAMKTVGQITIYPYTKWKYSHSLPTRYKDAYRNADKVILLSKNFIPQFRKYAHLDSADKFQIVPNGLSYDEYLPIERIGQKKPVALIVSRLDDPQKRISLALKIWNEVKRRPEAQDWQLNIVGHGRDEKKYRRMIQQLDIPDVHLLGRQQPKPYYKEASIFLMTSRSEGWGLTLTEAMQFGVVPIAFNSYASLEEIITDMVDGVIVPEGEIKEYVAQLLGLMADVDRRAKMAEEGIMNSKRFSQETVAKKWWNLLNDHEKNTDMCS